MLSRLKKVAVIVTATAMTLPVALASYTANYTSGDMPDIASDVIGHLAVNIITFAALIVLIWVAGMVMAKFGLRPKRRKF